MKTSCLRIYALLAILCLSNLFGPIAYAQDEFTVVTREFPLVDSYGRPWSDLSKQLWVDLDPNHTKDLPPPGTEIRAVNPKTNKEIKYQSGPKKPFPLKKNNRGETLAEVDYIVYKDPAKSIFYRVGLFDPQTKQQVPWLNTKSTQEVRNDNRKTGPNQTGVSNSPGSVLLNHIWLVLGVLVLGAIIIYLLVFRWLFSGLLHQWRWGVSSASHFTWSMSILLMLAIITGLAFYIFGPHLETWIIIGILVGLWLLHGVVWLVAGNRTA